MAQEAERECSKCARLLPASLFHRQGDGLRPDCKACRKVVQAAHREQNRDRINARNRAYQLANLDRYKAANKATKAKRAEHYQAVKDAWAAANPDAVRAKDARWRELHPEAARIANRRRQTRKRGATGRHTARDVLVLLELQRGRCVYCSADVRQRYHVDHIQALARGGSNDKTNLQILCPPCNQRKSVKDPLAFAQQLGRLL